MPKFTVPLRVRQSIQALIAVDPIVDLVELIDEYPTYAYFIEEAFGADRSTWEADSPARWGLYDLKEEKTEQDYLRILLLHSRQDELLSLRQPRYLVSRLVPLLGIENRGPPVGEGGGEGVKGSLEVDFETIQGKHERLPHTLILAQRVAKYVVQQRLKLKQGD